MLVMLGCLTMRLSRLSSSTAERIFVAGSFSATEVDHDAVNLRERKLIRIHSFGASNPDIAEWCMHAKQGTYAEPEAR